MPRSMLGARIAFVPYERLSGARFDSQDVEPCHRDWPTATRRRSRPNARPGLERAPGSIPQGPIGLNARHPPAPAPVFGAQRPGNPPLGIGVRPRPANAGPPLNPPRAPPRGTTEGRSDRDDRRRRPGAVARAVETGARSSMIGRTILVRRCRTAHVSPKFTYIFRRLTGHGISRTDPGDVGIPVIRTRRTEAALATNKLIRNTYTLLAMTLAFSALTAGVAMVINMPPGCAALADRRCPRRLLRAAVPDLQDRQQRHGPGMRRHPPAPAPVFAPGESRPRALVSGRGPRTPDPR